MSFISTSLPYIQVVLSVLLIGAVLLQRSEAALGGAFGGDGFSTAQHTKRGIEKTLFRATIALACLFVIATFLTLVI